MCSAREEVVEQSLEGSRSFNDATLVDALLPNGSFYFVGGTLFSSLVLPLLLLLEQLGCRETIMSMFELISLLIGTVSATAITEGMRWWL